MKSYYLAAFAAALLNNQPMGFYSPAVLVHDAQLHGLRVKPINALHSEWNCTIEHAMKDGQDVLSLRIGFRYVRGMRQTAAEKLVAERQRRLFDGIEDLIRRVPELQKPDPVTLSEIGAFNSLGKGMHRRSALWQVERAARPAGPLLDAIPEQMELAPLLQMTDKERLVADFHGSGMSTGPHPMSYCREALSKVRVKRAPGIHACRGMRHCAPASENGKRVCLPEPRRRNGNFQRHRESRPLGEVPQSDQP